MSPPAPDDRRCTAIRPSGERCRSWAKVDGDRCRVHSADAPPDDRRCTGIATGGTTRPERKGERCLAWALPGLTVCRFHGGSVKAAEAGRRRVVEAKLLAKAADLVGTPVDNPLTELANLAGRARAWMDLLERRVEKLLGAGDDADADGDGVADGIRYRGGAGEQIRGEIQLYERAMDRLGKFLADYGRLNIDSRLAAISEAQAERVVAAVDAVIEYLGATGEQAVQAKRVAARRLRAV